MSYCVQWRRGCFGGVIGLAAAMVSGGGWQCAWAGSFSFTKIADNNTLQPGGSGRFTLLDVASSSGGSDAFRGGSGDRSEHRGLYTRDAGGGIVPLVDFSTPVPGGVGPFSDFEGFVASGSSLGFVAEADDQLGFYTNVGGELVRVAVVDGPVPGESRQEFTGFREPHIRGDSVLFLGNVSSSPFSSLRLYSYDSDGGLAVIAGPSVPVPGGGGNFSRVSSYAISGSAIALLTPEGVYTDAGGGGLVSVADATTPIPGGVGDFTSWSRVSVSGSSVVFRGEDSADSEGVYLKSSGSVLAAVADTGTLVPGGVGLFSDFGEVAVSGSTVVFEGEDEANNDGLYARTDGGEIMTIVDMHTPVPGGEGDFDGFFFDGSVIGSTVYFWGSESGTDRRGLYGYSEGGLSEVAVTGSMINGKMVGAAGPIMVLNEDSILFPVGFQDGSGGIYKATLVPEPSTGSVGLLVGVVALGRGRWSGGVAV